MHTLLFRTSACQHCSHSKALYDSHRYLFHYRSLPPAWHRSCSSHIHLSTSWPHVGKQGHSWDTYMAICSIEFYYKGLNLWSQEESLWSCGNWPVWEKREEHEEDMPTSATLGQQRVCIEKFEIALKLCPSNRLPRTLQRMLQISFEWSAQDHFYTVTELGYRFPKLKANLNRYTNRVKCNITVTQYSDFYKANTACGIVLPTTACFGL